MFRPGQRVGVAVSGGADSVCLLLVLIELAPRWNLQLELLHVNHALRGEESKSDEAFVREQALGSAIPRLVRGLAWLALLLLRAVDDRLHRRLGVGDGAVDVVAKERLVDHLRPRTVGGVDQIVEHHRGGFCYELNGLFALLLRALGFHVDMLSAAVAKPEGGFGPEFDHLTLLVHLEQDWLADVGFGESFRQPLRLQAGLTQQQSEGSYLLEREEGSWIYQEWEDGAWKPAYRFSLQPHVLSDFAAMCRYHQTSPESTFTQERVCSLATRSGRITLSDQRLITTREGERTERVLTDQEYRTVLTEQFGIVLSPMA